ncbi:class I SAM-dependent methyltransferase [Granulicella arctica]|uniref:class I SAM-dependent methyltransferase n=1 Tax=Granulicella arctica TaxID=940613 RepID=UPI0021E0BE3C|nr:class I SAM-dependent methyltransferase [Granulicella arctica]
MPAAPDVYDLIAYPGFAYANTHPDSLATMAILHGLDPTPVERCRVLEVGCNEGSNLIPMAYSIPGGEFVGFDLASVPVAHAQQRIRQLGLTNVRIFQADILTVGDDPSQPLGTFDYIIAHGVYAWVPEHVRDALLALCRDHLAPNGIGFISYNALPGGHLRDLNRDILSLRSTASDDPIEGINQGLELMQFVIEARPEHDPLRLLLESQIKQLRKRGHGVIFHDELAPAQRPVSVTTFVSHAGGHGLRYVSEASMPPPNDACFQPKTAATAKAMAHGDWLAEEQILDFARMRKYRETLLCRTDRPVTIDLRLDRLSLLRFASPAQVATAADPAKRVFILPNTLQMESQHPGTIALLDHLIAAWPSSVPFAEIASLLTSNDVALDAEFFTLLIRLVVARVITLHTWKAPVSSRVGRRPLVSAIARQEASTADTVTTLLHTTLSVADPVVREFVLLLDGSRERGALLKAFQQAHPDQPEASIVEGIEATLQLLNRAGTLLADNAQEETDQQD